MRITKHRLVRRVMTAAAAIVLAVGMVVGAPGLALAQSEIQGHWNEAALEQWMGYGILKGYDDGRIAPDDYVTRAQMVAFLDRTMKYQDVAENTYPDVVEGSWYAEALLRGVAAGVIVGDTDTGMMRPNDYMTREEAAAVIARAVALDDTNAPDAGFSDQSEISPWAQGVVNAMAAKGYVHGYDGYFRPGDKVTRAELIAMLDNVFANLYQEKGEYTGNVEGSAVINADGVTLKDMTISGDLIIAEGVGDGHVELDNVTVEGRLIVRGGGENSVIIKGASKIGQIIVDRLAGAVRVAVEDAAEVAGVTVTEATDGVRLEGKVGDLSVQGAASVVEVAGTANTVDVAETATDAKVTLLEGSEAKTVTSQAKTATITIQGTVATVSVSGEGNQLTVSGSVSAIDVTGNGAAIKVEASAKVEKVFTSATGTKVEGEGKVEAVVAGEGSSDVTVSTENTMVENDGSGDVTIEGGTVAPGESDTTPGGTTSGGGSTGGGIVVPPVHTHNYVDGVCAEDGAYDPTWAQVATAAEWNKAMDGSVKGIVVTDDFTADAQLKVTRAVTINGNNHVVTAGSWSDANTTSKGDAALVSVIAGENKVAIKNITLSSAQSLGDDYGHGLNVYGSSNVELSNVTLSGNAAAGMVVASSNVSATGLHTSGNGWGGVNVDKGSAGNPSNAVFTFDATSTFGETTPKPAVYSDKGDVTVNAPEGWAAVPASGKTVWAKLFAGGDGSENSPYEISSLAEWKNLSYVATKNYSFKLMNDITLESTESMLPQFVGTLDGNNNTITLPNEPANANDWVAFAEEATGVIKNLVIEHGADEVIPFVAYAEGEKLEFDNVNICTPSTAKTCMMSNNDNNESAYVVQSFASSLVFNNCDNYLSYYHNGGSNMYTSAFLGGYASGACSVSFNDCWNYGNLEMSHASLFIGNGFQMDKANVSVTNSGNYGQIVGYESAKPFAAISTNVLKDSESLNASNYNAGEGKIFALPKMEGLGLSLDNDQTIVISAPDNLSDVTFNLTFAAYGATNDSTYLFNVVIPLTKPGDTNCVRYKMVDIKTAESLNINVGQLSFVETGTAGMRYAISGSYLVCDFGEYAEGEVSLNNSNPTVSVSVVNSNGDVIGYARLA